MGNDLQPRRVRRVRIGVDDRGQAVIRGRLQRVRGVLDPVVRAALYQTIGNDLNAKSPFFPLLQPGQVVTSSKNLTKTTFNVVYWIDVTAVGSK